MADAFAASDLIQARLRAAWTATPPDRLRWDDNGPLLDMSQLTPYCQAEMSYGPDSPYIGQPGARLNRIDGVLMLHCMAPRQDGVAAIRAMLRDARAALANQNFDGVYLQGLSPNRGRPADEDGSYFGTTAVLHFTFLYHDAA